MTQYEVLYVLPGTVTEAETEPMLKKMTDILEGSGAEGFTLFPQGKHRLAYPIRHIRYGYVYVGRFRAEKSAVPAMQERLRLLSEPLRVMISAQNPHLSGDPVVRYMREEVAEKTPATPEIALDQVPTAKKTETKEREPVVEVSAAEIDKQLDKILDTDLQSV
jgi:ribosomal protein S6